MKTKRYRHGSTSFKAYCKRVGHGFEVALTKGSKILFIGHFTNSSQANRFWSTMNRQIRTFGKRFKIPSKNPSAWYVKFLSNLVHKHYFAQLNKTLPSQGRTYQSAAVRDLRKYKRLKKKPGFNQSIKKTQYLRAA